MTYHSNYSSFNSVAKYESIQVYQVILPERLISGEFLSFKVFLVATMLKNRLKCEITSCITNVKIKNYQSPKAWTIFYYGTWQIWPSLVNPSVRKIVCLRTTTSSPQSEQKQVEGRNLQSAVHSVLLHLLRKLAILAFYNISFVAFLNYVQFQSTTSKLRLNFRLIPFFFYWHVLKFFRMSPQRAMLKKFRVPAFLRNDRIQTFSVYAPRASHLDKGLE